LCKVSTAEPCAGAAMAPAARSLAGRSLPQSGLSLIRNGRPIGWGSTNRRPNPDTSFSPARESARVPRALPGTATRTRARWRPPPQHPAQVPAWFSLCW
jgi:hypothetical protein